MYKIYNKWPELAMDAYQLNHDLIDFKKIDHIVFAGMGGSGTIGDVFSSILSKTNIHVAVVKGYLLPNTVDANTLVVATSVSGNTTETLTILNTTRKLNCKVIAFSSGGKMQQFCTKNRIEYRKIPKNHSPRASFPIFLYSMLNVLAPIIHIKKEDVEESISLLGSLRKEIDSSNLAKTNPSLQLAEWMKGIPLIYYPFGLRAAAMRFKNSLQENCKLHTISENVIEACHNDIVAWEKKSNVMPILLRGQNDYVKTKERWDILKQYFKINNIDHWEISSVKGSILSKITSLIYLLDYATIYRAVLSKLDPTPVPSIDFVKRRLKP